MNIPEATSTVEDDVERADSERANWEIQRLRRSSRIRQCSKKLDGFQIHAPELSPLFARQTQTVTTYSVRGETTLELVVAQKLRRPEYTDIGESEPRALRRGRLDAKYQNFSELHGFLSFFCGYKVTKALSTDWNIKMQLTLDFGGGLELLCESVKIHQVDVKMKTGEKKLTMKDLLIWIQANVIKERPEMFVKGDTVRPGVLVLINDCDWELCGQLDATLEEKDAVTFISTLHGG
ncbi:hypothetical protein H6P81_002700 [Aristolochia fimbriata]|uniref:Ubiquitin-related modifier 1 homolog n=1 Tax=Aristolochia fimbriata TaxID=158543 RepID=A0AAV7FEL7_ARIFI|nr:hypothetical protein H6P81_002700 [Aristolochia fimbriata]